MSISVQLLNSDEHLDLLVEAYRWRHQQPRWFRECLDIFKESEEEYLENLKDELHYGVFNDDEFQAVIRLVPAGNGIYNIHLSVRKGIDWQVLLAAGTSLKEFLFDQGVVSFYGYLPTVNKGISKLYESLGFSDTGIRIFKGIIHNKIVEWKHYAILNPNAVE